MAESRTVMLTETNWKQLDMLLEKLLPNDFINFYLMNVIIEEGIQRCKEKYLLFPTTL